jgi:hypothetical protein
MLAFFYVSAFVVGAWAPFVWAHREVHGAVNPAHVALTLFNAVNLLICLWEHALFLHRGKIRREHARLKRKHGDRALPKPLCLFEDISLAQALSYEHWSIIWSQYSLLDPSYADQRSFGFWVDSGNGLVTLPATLLLSHAATYAGTSCVLDVHERPSRWRASCSTTRCSTAPCCTFAITGSTGTTSARRGEASRR